jgi:hypothetical protein
VSQLNDGFLSDAQYQRIFGHILDQISMQALKVFLCYILLKYPNSIPVIAYFSN